MDRYQKRREYNLAWKKANRDKIRAAPSGSSEKLRAYRLKNAYGITLADYAALVLKQGNKCAICKTREPSKRHGKWVVDHDHKTGKVRGLLCDPCNRGLGHFRDDLKLLIAASKYLKARGQPRVMGDGASPDKQ